MTIVMKKSTEKSSKTSKPSTTTTLTPKPSPKPKPTKPTKQTSAPTTTCRFRPCDDDIECCFGDCEFPDC